LLFGGPHWLVGWLLDPFPGVTQSLTRAFAFAFAKLFESPREIWKSPESPSNLKAKGPKVGYISMISYKARSSRLWGPETKGVDSKGPIQSVRLKRARLKGGPIQKRPIQRNPTQREPKTQTFEKEPPLLPIAKHWLLSRLPKQES
jgi:hypothetical protein